MFSRRYRAALLDYLLESGESGRERAYELGRRAVNDGVGLLHILRVHEQAFDSILAAIRKSDDKGLHQLKASHEFLMETLSAFEMAYRGYVELIDYRDNKAGRHRWARSREAFRPQV